MIELLSPAGDLDCLKVAVSYGADAVYLGVKDFSARRNAGNFSFNELLEGVSFAHSNGVRVYVALNTLIKNSELDSFFEIVKKVYELGVDAVIVQDLFLGRVIKVNFRGMEVHASTQARLFNSEAINNFSFLDRVILPREVSKKEVELLVKRSNVPLELFVHGAECFSFSGLCLMSSFIGGRSGNRGLCAQPCRKKYNGEYKFSMKDLSLVSDVDWIKKSGIASIKIEGRMRSKEYVSAATRVFRKAIDGEVILDSELEALRLSFNRDFTRGYFVGEKNIISNRPMNKGIFLGRYSENMKLSVGISVGDGVGIWKNDKVDGEFVRKILFGGESVSSASKGDRVRVLLNKASNGDEIYKTSSKEFPIKPLARNLDKIYVSRNEVSLPNFSFNEGKADVGFFVEVSNLEDAKIAFSFDLVKGVIFPAFHKDASKVARLGNVYLRFSVVVSEMDLDRQKARFDEISPFGVFVTDFSQRNFKGEKIFSSFMNFFNDVDLDYGKAVLSPELISKDFLNFVNKDFIVFAHGPINSMVTLFPLDEGILKDEKGFKFRVRREGKVSFVENPSDLGLFGEVKTLADNGVNQFYFNLRKNVREILDVYSRILASEKVKFNKKRYIKGKGVL